MDKQTLYLCHLPYPESSRWFPGDQYLRRIARKALEPFRGRPPGGLTKVTANLILGLKKLGIPYRLCTNLSEIPENELVGLLHGPLDLCKQIAERNPCITGPGILNGSREWPDLFSRSKAIFHIQNCEWAAAMYRPQYGDKIRIWAMGVDEERYRPQETTAEYDFLIYDKIRWPNSPEYSGLLESCKQKIQEAGCSALSIRYGKYPGGKESSYHSMLRRCRAMLYLSENETQGFAYNEALSMNVPILAWNFGTWCDPMRHQLKMEKAPATSIPYWDERCGLDFQGIGDLPGILELFLEKLKTHAFAPRDYVLEHLRIDQGAKRYLELYDEARSLL
ncbi:MAG: glycosyltransferase [Bdellovibrionales bacterium]|nr:glycosyltransferase [Bdellovibrionales bacterium]